MYICVCVYDIISHIRYVLNDMGILRIYYRGSEGVNNIGILFDDKKW